MKRLAVCAALAALGLSMCAGPEPGPETMPEPLSSDERMGWWREARFGMFIHWGLYSVLGGEWEGFDYGKEMGGASAEWIMLQAAIPKEEYSKLAGQFNPVKFDADRWASIAKRAGMKYLVITSKHHDGFSLFDSEHTDYDIMDASPFRRDIIAELAEACRKQGIRFGVYYSQSKDWYHRKLLRQDPDPPSDAYREFVKAQVTELLTNYGDIAVLWFDTGDAFTEINSEYGRLVRRLSPPTIIGSRLAGDPSLHDFRTMADRSIPEGNVDFDAESPMTMRDNWGFDRDDTNWKSERELLQRFSLTICRGANMLLNVGPTPEGELMPEEIVRLEAIGRWLEVNGEAVYGSQGGPFAHDFEWGSISQRRGRLYLHIYEWNPNGLRLDGLLSKVRRAYLLADPNGSELHFEQDVAAGSLQVATPGPPPDENVSVVVLEIDGGVEIDRTVTGERHWNIGTGIRLNEEKIERQRAQGWLPSREPMP